MDKVSGQVEKFGSRVTHAEDNVIVEELVRITIDPTPNQKKAEETDAVGLVERLLTQEGRKFKNVKIAPDSKIISHQRSVWYHVVVDRQNPQNECTWIDIRDWP